MKKKLLKIICALFPSFSMHFVSLHGNDSIILDINFIVYFILFIYDFSLFISSSVET